MVLAALSTVAAIQTVSAFAAQRVFNANGKYQRPHAVIVDTLNLDKRDTAPAFQSLQDEWSAEISSVNAQRFEKSTAVPEVCKKGIHNIETAGQLFELQQQCRSIMGSVQIMDFVDPVIDFGSLQNINGDLIIENLPDVVRVQGHNLASVGGSFKINSLTSLTSVYFPVLHHFNAIEWTVVPTLTSLNLAPNISFAKRITISDTSLIGVDVLENVEDLEVLNINNNRYMEYMKVNVKQVHEQLSISSNSRELKVEFPQLQWANNLTVRDVSLADFPNLKHINHSLEVIENDFDSFEVPNLETIGGTLGLIQNARLHKVDLGSVKIINGGLMVANNSNIDKINFLPQLREIGGAIHFIGTFQETDFPSLRLVRGSALVQSTSSTLDCAKWTTPRGGNSIIRGGRIACTAGQKKNTARVSQDGRLLDHQESMTETSQTSAKESNLASSNVDKTKLSAFAWSLSFGWIVALLCLITTQ